MTLDYLKMIWNDLEKTLYDPEITQDVLEMTLDDPG